MPEQTPWPDEQPWPSDPWDATAAYPPQRPPDPRYPPSNRPRERNEDADYAPYGGSSYQRGNYPPTPPQSPYGAPSNYGPPPAWNMPAPVAPLPTAATERTTPRHREPPHRLGWSLPIEHIVLAAGLVGMFLALSQPWGSDVHGNAIYLGSIAYRAAYYTLGGLTVLGGLLVLLNRRMGCLAFAGCLMLFMIPIVVAASVGGIETLTQLHVIPHLTPENVKITNRGFFLWWGGLGVTIIGLLFEVITHRRKGLIGI